MNYQILTLSLLSLVVLVAPAGNTEENQEAQAELSCDVGPISRNFGGSDWIVYSCDDKNTFVVVSAEGNPAAPFYFISTIKDNSRTLQGEGSGEKAASSAAYEDLRKFISSEDQVQDLLLQTRTKGSP